MSTHADSKLFQPLRIGTMDLAHRVVMAPLTRYRADDAHVPLPFVKEYYGQRASVPGTLLITEATFISPRAGGYRNIPGIWNDDQIRAWKEVTDEVHRKGSYIYLQMWALGRAAKPDVLEEEGYTFASASDIPMTDNSPVPRPLEEDEIQEFIKEYAQAARNSIAAGFDGVEVHSANGYLPNQFLSDTSNRRTDKWGGSIENRARFGLEVTKAVVEAVGAERVGLRISPYSSFQGMQMEDPVPQYSYYVEQLKKFNLAYLHVVESRVSGSADQERTEKITFVTDIWGNQSPVLIAGGFKAASAFTAVDEEFRDIDAAVVFGRYFISNPDLPFRLKEGIEFKHYNRDTFYIPKAKEGYIDYPFSEQWTAHASKESRL